MHELIAPKEVKISELKKKGSFSPSNYKKLLIENQNQKYLADYLKSDSPHDRGVEPGSSAYVDFSEQIFLRNSCINNISFSVDKEKYKYINPHYIDDNVLKNEDVLLCTDANIGDSALYLSDDEKVIISSGIVRLNFRDERDKYYVLAFLRDNYFREQLETLTPKGATIKHSGELYLQCLIPECPKDWVYIVIENLIKNIAYAEYFCNIITRKTEKMIDEEIMVKRYDYENPSIKVLLEKERLDSGIYSEKVFQWKKNIENYKYGFTNLDGFGFKTKRGPSLQVRDLGRAIKTTEYRKGYNVLIYPSDISSAGYIEKTVYLGARNPVWFLSEKYILFSSEGTIGKTFIVCDDTMKFTTNIHGTMIFPKKQDTDISKSVFLGLYLNYLRSKGVIDKMSVGANGGSFAVGYWDNIIIPLVDDLFMKKLSNLYNNPIELNPTIHNKKMLQKAGIYQLNNFLIKSKIVLEKICNDIKNNQLMSQEFYSSYFE